MRLYKVISLESLPTGDGGWEVNDAHYTGHEVELADATVASVLKALKGVGLLYKHITRQSICIDWEASSDDGSRIFIKAKRSGKGLWELQEVKS